MRSDSNCWMEVLPLRPVHYQCFEVRWHNTALFKVGLERVFISLSLATTRSYYGTPIGSPMLKVEPTSQRGRTATVSGRNGRATLLRCCQGDTLFKARYSDQML